MKPRVQIGIGYSKLPAPHEAAREAARMALASAGNPSLAFLFTTEEYDQQAGLKTVLEETRYPRLVGASGAGLVTPEGITTQGVGIVALSGTGISATTAIVEMNPELPGTQAGNWPVNS
ncbi:FIST N-terminal domain-containing protein [Thermodesulfitimonas sp.]